MDLDLDFTLRWICRLVGWLLVLNLGALVVGGIDWRCLVVGRPLPVGLLIVDLVVGIVLLLLL